MIRWILISFFAVQFFFTLFDLLFLWRKQANKSFWQTMRKDWSTIETILFFWLLYFILQTLGVALIPSINKISFYFHNWLNIPIAESEFTFSDILPLMSLHLWTYLLISFWDYATHRWILHHPWFWIFHEYHHVPKKVFNGMPGISVRPYVFATTTLTYLGVIPFLLLPLKWLVSPTLASLFIQTLPIQSLLLTLILSIVHSHWLRTLPWVHRTLKAIQITSPQEHTLHHSQRLYGNYGNFSCLWDHLFRTYLDPVSFDIENEPLGLSYDQDFLGALCKGYFKMPTRWRSKSHIEDFCRIQ